jgi:hypothetical protein
MNENEKLIINATVLRGDRKTLTCAQAFTLSQDHSISLKEIGEACNQHGIKIIDCELGCFK